MTETSKEERDSWRTIVLHSCPFLRLLTDADRCEELEHQLILARETMAQCDNREIHKDRRITELEVQVDTLANQKAELDEETLWLTEQNRKLQVVADAARVVELQAEVERLREGISELHGKARHRYTVDDKGVGPLAVEADDLLALLAESERETDAELEPEVEQLRAKLQSLTSVPYGNDLLLVRPLQCKYSGSWMQASEQEPVRVSLSMVGVNARDDTLYVRWPADAGYAEQSIYGWPLSELAPGGALRPVEDDGDQDEP